jgi:hypothetical protein
MRSSSTRLSSKNGFTRHGYKSHIREEGIREIEKTVREVNDIFKDLAVIVHDQGQLIGSLAVRPFLMQIRQHRIVDH